MPVRLGVGRTMTSVTSVTVSLRDPPAAGRPGGGPARESNCLEVLIVKVHLSDALSWTRGPR